MTEHRGYPAQVEHPDATSRFVLVCEHASNAFPAPWGGLGLDAAAQAAHIAWDPGALGLARGLAARLDACLVHAPVSRLIHDLNRAPDSPGAMPERSEVFDIPGNRGLSPAARAARVAAVYDPFHAGLAAVIARRIALGLRPVIVTVHSFTPVWHGVARSVEFGVIHDDTRPGDDRLARAVLAAAWSMTDLRAELNEPYSAADGVTHLLRLHAVPYGLPHAMLEIRNDRIADAPAQEAMADRLAPVLARALAQAGGV
jgi:predicted N-formylglutamate amidohydrolase